MRLAKVKNIVMLMIVFGVFAVAYWVSRVPYQSDEPIHYSNYVIISSPANGLAGASACKLKGFVIGNVIGMSFDLFNAKERQTNQQKFKIWSQECEGKITNYFEGPNLTLSPGTNLIILHTTFHEGQTLTNQVTCFLDGARLAN